ncbi:MAG: 50S ribosomal protein L7/L12 [Cyanobacteriota bacterium]
MSTVVDEILEKIEKLTLLEAADLVKKMEDKFGVSAAAAPVMMAGPAGPAGPAAEEEEVDVSVILVSVGNEKIKVLKEIRAITGLALKEAKELVDNPPKPVKEGLKKEEAAELKKKLEELGATIEVK